MDRLRRIEVLVKVADSGSFAKAAAHLLVTPSAVSHAVAQLEAELRVRLVYRTTRLLRLTTEGADVVRRGRDVLSRMAELETAASGKREELGGTLRIGVPSGVARHILMPALPDFARRFPELKIVMINTGSIVDMHATGADVNFRIGAVPDSELICRALATLKFGVYAAPLYLRDHRMPVHPSELSTHRGLVHKPLSSSTVSPWDRWDFENEHEGGHVEVGHHLVTDDREALLVAALSGAGLFRIGMFSPGLLSSGQLVRLLGDWRWPGGPELSLLYRRLPRQPRRISAFIEFAANAVAAFDPLEMTLEHRPLRTLPQQS
ncbi:MAG: LysR family transcriptional regulator [Burkholderiaceae bacterium]